MTVIHLTNCPPSLRGDLTKWLIQIAEGVYVGRISARVRDKLWDRIVETSKGGRAVLVYNTNNEQHMDFRIHGETWEPIDFDGLKLMLRPNQKRNLTIQISQDNKISTGFSNASKFQKAKQSKRKTSSTLNDINSFTNDADCAREIDNINSYIVIDIETTGLDALVSEIIEIGAIKITDGKIVDVFQSLTRIEKPIPSTIKKLTGITDKKLQTEGKLCNEVLSSFLEFVNKMPLIAHNMPFDLSFLNSAMKKNGFGFLKNQTIDTLALTKKIYKNLKSYKLKDLSTYFNFHEVTQSEYQFHRSLGDCYMTHLLYQKLINFEMDNE